MSTSAARQHRTHQSGWRGMPAPASAGPQDRRARSKAKTLERQRERGRQGRRFETSFGDEATADEERRAYDEGKAAREKGMRQQGRKIKRSDAAKKATGKARTTARKYANPRSRQRSQLRAKRRTVTRAARQLNPTVAGTITSGSQALLLSIVVVGLYVVLQNTGPLTGFLGGLGKALEWLSSPDKVIPHKG